MRQNEENILFATFIYVFIFSVTHVRKIFFKRIKRRAVTGNYSVYEMQNVYYSQSRLLDFSSRVYFTLSPRRVRGESGVLATQPAIFNIERKTAKEPENCRSLVITSCFDINDRRPPSLPRETWQEDTYFESGSTSAAF